MWKGVSWQSKTCWYVTTLNVDLVNNGDRSLQGLPGYVHRVYFAGNRRRRENRTSAQKCAITSLRPWLRSSLKSLGVMLLSRKVPLLLIFCTRKMTCMHFTVAELFTSDWQTSRVQCPTIKRVYMVVVGKSFETSFEKYRWVTSSFFQFQFQTQ